MSRPFVMDPVFWVHYSRSRVDFLDEPPRRWDDAREIEDVDAAKGAPAFRLPKGDLEPLVGGDECSANPRSRSPRPESPTPANTRTSKESIDVPDPRRSPPAARRPSTALHPGRQPPYRPTGRRRRGFRGLNTQTCSLFAGGPTNRRDFAVGFRPSTTTPCSRPRYTHQHRSAPRR